MSINIPSVRISPDNATVLSQLGLLKDLAGNWHGHGFNLVARPDFQIGPTVNLFLELNQTEETLKFDPISSSIPNRGTFQDDLELFGLTYLQRISDATTGGALHIEPGIWVTHKPTTEPPENPPSGGQIVARMGSIPHGNALLAGGSAVSFTGPPTLGVPSGAGTPAFSIFPSFNSTPIPVPVPPAPTVIRAAGTSEFASIAGGGFTQYTLTNAASVTNPRTPFGNTPAIPLPANIIGVPMQDVVNDPIQLLQQVIKNQVADGHTFEGTVLNIATISPIEFATTPPPPTTTPPTTNAPLGPTVSVSVADASGGAENLPFLLTNADAVLVYATFWIEKVTPKSGPHFMQLQYAQMVLLNFPANGIPAPAALPPPASDQGKLNFSWPHVSVATLRKTFG